MKEHDMELQAWMIRILAGGLAGTLFFFCLGGFFNAITADNLVYLPGSSLPFQAVSGTLAASTGSPFLAGLIQYGLYFALGAGIGVATLPFAEDGKALLIRSLLHFAYSAAVSSALLWLSGWNRGSFLMWLAELGVLVLLYLLIWFGRWLSWWFELDAIRERLGLAQPVSPLKFRETLPHLGYAALLCLAVPALLLALLHLFRAPSLDRLEVWACFLVSPLAALSSLVPGVSLGRRHGICPLYPIAIGLFLLAALSVFYDAGILSLPCAGITALFAFAGNAIGTLRRRRSNARRPQTERGRFG